MPKMNITGSIKIGDEPSSVTYPFSKQISYTAGLNDKFIIPANTEVIIWDPINSAVTPITDFDFLCLKADKNLEIELTIDENDPNQELISFEIIGGVPFILASSNAFRSHGADDIFAGVRKKINKIKVKEIAGNAVNLRIILVT